MAEESYQSPVGSPPKYSDPNATSAFTTQFVLDDPVIEAIYPSFIIISWTPPRHVSSPAVGPPIPQNRATWKYVVEWIGSFSVDTHTAHMNYCHAVLPVEFSHESYVIRLVAKGTILASVDQSTNVFVTASITVPTRQATATHLPWLLDGAVLSPVLRDALLLGGHLHDLEDAMGFMWNLASDSSAVKRSSPEYLGKGALKHCQFTAVRVQYALRESAALNDTQESSSSALNKLMVPLRRSDVVFVLTEPLSPSASPSPTRTSPSTSSSTISGAQLVDLVKEKGCSLVFTGVGGAGTAASFAAHRLIASVLLATDNAGDGGSASPEKSLLASPQLRERTTSGHRALRRSSGGGGVGSSDDLSELDPVCRHVFSITFGSPREDFFSNGVVLARTTQYSGQFLHYTSSVSAAARTSGFLLKTAAPTPTGSAPSSHPTKSPAAAASSSSTNSSGVASLSKHASVPLGVRVGPVLDITSGRHYLRATASHFERRGDDDEHSGPFDVLGALVMLDVAGHRSTDPITGERRSAAPQRTIADALCAYRPTVKSVSATSDAERTGFSVFLTIRGTMLHLQPRVVIDLLTCNNAEDDGEESASPARRTTSMLGRSAVGCELVYVSPLKVLARCTLPDVASLYSITADPNPVVTFSVHVANSAGAVGPIKVTLRLSDLHVVLAAGPLPTAPDHWINGQPMDLLNVCVTLEPVLASAQSPDESSFLPHTTTKLLMALENIAEIVTANVAAGKKNASGTSFFSALAAKVSTASASTPTTSSAPSPSLAQPMAHVAPGATGSSAGTFFVSLADHIHKRRPARTFGGCCAAWRSKLLAAFPWLSDGVYSTKLRSLVDVLILERPTITSLATANPAGSGGQRASQPSSPNHANASPTSQMEMRSFLGAAHGDGPSATSNFFAMEALMLTHLIDYVSRRARVFPKATFMEPLTNLMSFEVFYRTIHPLLLAAATGLESKLSGIKTPLDVLLEAAALWVIAILVQLRLQHALHRTLLICTPSRNCGASTLMNELKLMRNDDEHDVLGQTMASRRPLPTTASTSSLGDSTNNASPSATPTTAAQPSQKSSGAVKTLRQLQRVLIHRLVAETMDDAMEVASLCGDVLMVFSAEAHDIAAPASQHWLREVSARRAGRVIVVVTKFDECLLQHEKGKKDQRGIFMGGVPPLLTQDVEGFVRSCMCRLRDGLSSSVHSLQTIPVALAPSKQTIRRVPEFASLSEEQIEEVCEVMGSISSMELRTLLA